jgi:hypothetical protein
VQFYMTAGFTIESEYAWNYSTYIINQCLVNLPITPPTLLESLTEFFIRNAGQKTDEQSRSISWIRDVFKKGHLDSYMRQGHTLSLHLQVNTEMFPNKISVVREYPNNTI